MADTADTNDDFFRLEEQIGLGLFHDAEQSCRQILDVAPQQVRAWHSLGTIYLLTGRWNEAQAALTKAIELDASQAACWNDLAVVCNALGNADTAEIHALKAVELAPSVDTYWLNLGNALFRQMRWSEALQAYEDALNCNPQNTVTWNGLGAAQQKLGQLASAQDSYDHSLRIAANNTDAWTNLGHLFNERGQPERAIQLLQPKLALEPRIPGAWVALGNAFQLLCEWTDAQNSFQKALHIAPTNRNARHGLAKVLYRQWLLPAADRAATKLVADEPHYADAWALLGEIKLVQGEADEAVRLQRHSIALEPSPDRESQLLLSMQYTDAVEADQLLRAHREWDSKYAKDLNPLSPPGITERCRGKPIRLGILSSDFGRHPIGFLALRAMECLDKDNCSLICYSDRFGDDEYTARFRNAADVWRVTVSFSADEFAEQIRRDQIDILVDLQAHTSRRLHVLARKPAPLQVSWLGYPGTTGLSAIDFLLADSLHVRVGEETNFSETVLRMPNGYACYGPPDNAPDVGPLPTLTGNRFTFGCFNNPAKFSSCALDLWAQILRLVPRARLFLKFNGLNYAEIQSKLRARFAERGIVGDQILFEGESPHLDLLAAYNRVDLALDTQPYSGGLTTCEALWMGVPVVTCPGKTFAGRHSASHLSNAGVPQFVAQDLNGYVKLAVDWANRVDELASIRAEMREQVQRSPLYDAPRFARDFLDVLAQAWESRRTKSQ